MKYIIKIDNKYLVSRRWHFKNKLHREDGPAVEWADGSKWWYLNGKYLTEAEYNARKE